MTFDRAVGKPWEDQPELGLHAGYYGNGESVAANVVGVLRTRELWTFTNSHHCVGTLRTTKRNVKT